MPNKKRLSERCQKDSRGVELNPSPAGPRYDLP